MLHLSKLLTQMSYPLALCLLLVPGGLLLVRWHWQRVGGSMIAFGLAWLLLWSLPMPSFWLRAGLERQTPQRAAPSYPEAAAIVVLGGGVDGRRPDWRDTADLSAAADRVWFAAQLWHAGRAPLVILSGGTLDDSDAAEPEADAMAAFIADLGVPHSALLLERQSRNTWENAVQTGRVLRERGMEEGKVLLVTSALHMPRAVALFRKQGIDVIAAPTDFEAVPPLGLRWLPDARALYDSSRALKEYLGLWAYRVGGAAK